MKKILSFNTLVFVAVGLGIIAGSWGNPFVMVVAQNLSDIFIRLLKLVSLPIIFLSIVSTAIGMDDMEELKKIGIKVLKYTLLTTVIAATIALSAFLLIQPARVVDGAFQPAPNQDQTSYWTYLVQAIPSNVVQPFLEHNVMGVLLLAIFLSLALLALPKEKRQAVHTVFDALYAAFMKITGVVVKLMPLAIFAFVVLFVEDLKRGLEIRSLALYLLTVVVANLVQANVVLPLLLKFKGISPTKLFRSMLPALSVAFFSKSSSASIPTAIQCAETKGDVSGKVARFSFPLCTTINMNACAAFILITVLFVSTTHGITFSGPEMVAWIFLATIAAVGNAGVPMGCYFLSSAFLAAMNVPLHILGVILPFYTLLDMLESAINVWSDSCVTAIVDREIVETQPEMVLDFSSSI